MVKNPRPRDSSKGVFIYPYDQPKWWQATEEQKARPNWKNKEQSSKALRGGGTAAFPSVACVLRRRACYDAECCCDDETRRSPGCREDRLAATMSHRLKRLAAERSLLQDELCDMHKYLVTNALQQTVLRKAVRRASERWITSGFIHSKQLRAFTGAVQIKVVAVFAGQVCGQSDYPSKASWLSRLLTAWLPAPGEPGGDPFGECPL